MSFNEISVGGVPVGAFSSFQQVINLLYQQLEDRGGVTAIAINPEKILTAQQDPEVLAILQDCDIRYADGIGVVKAMQAKTKRDVIRLPGCELWEAFLEDAGKRETKVFLVGASESTLNKTVEKVKQQFRSNLVGHQHGFFTDEKSLIERIKSSEAEIVTVAMGSPKQEKFISNCRAAGVKAIFMGVGGTYDVFIGEVDRAPIAFRKLGLEWFYRLIKQPSRWRRHLNLLKFLGLYLTNRL